MSENQVTEIIVLVAVLAFATILVIVLHKLVTGHETDKIFKLESIGFSLMLGGLLLRDLWKLGILIFRHDPNSQFEFGSRDLVEIFLVVAASGALYVGAKIIMKRFDVE
jgi:Na+/H+ antiporter NhaC